MQETTALVGIENILSSIPHTGIYVLFSFQADVFVNSTNSDLDLSRGYLSKQLLKKCGQDLQKECNEYAPLMVGQVAITSAKNLHCQHIFHVALPDYKTKGSLRVRYCVTPLCCLIWHK